MFDSEDSQPFKERIFHTCVLKSTCPAPAAFAFSAGDLSSVIAAPAILKGRFCFKSPFDDFGFPKFDKGCQYLYPVLS